MTNDGYTLDVKRSPIEGSNIPDIVNRFRNLSEEEMELVRAEAEKARAIADKAYQNALGLSADQFIQLKYIEMIANKDGANIDVLVGGNTSNMWNVRR